MDRFPACVKLPTAARQGHAKVSLPQVVVAPLSYKMVLPTYIFSIGLRTNGPLASLALLMTMGSCQGLLSASTRPLGTGNSSGSLHLGDIQHCRLIQLRDPVWASSSLL